MQEAFPQAESLHSSGGDSIPPVSEVRDKLPNLEERALTTKTTLEEEIDAEDEALDAYLRSSEQEDSEAVTSQGEENIKRWLEVREASPEAAETLLSEIVSAAYESLFSEHWSVDLKSAVINEVKDDMRRRQGLTPAAFISELRLSLKNKYASLKKKAA